MVEYILGLWKKSYLGHMNNVLFSLVLKHYYVAAQFLKTIPMQIRQRLNSVSFRNSTFFAHKTILKVAIKVAVYKRVDIKFLIVIGR